METLEVLINLARTIELQIMADQKKDGDPLEKSLKAIAKNEVLIEIYKFINKEK